ncbi:hypothetical protein QQ045_010751 [Rhodiola kirilowii]
MAENDSLEITGPSAPSIHKQNSDSLDLYREEAWLRRKESRSLTEDDLDELKACIELGFRFEMNTPKIDRRLSDAIPALELYYAVNKQYHNVISRLPGTIWRISRCLLMIIIHLICFQIMPRDAVCVVFLFCSLVMHWRFLGAVMVSVLRLFSN